MIDDPTWTLRQAESYQDAWSAVKQNQQQRLFEEQILQELEHQLSLASNELEAISRYWLLEQNKLRARAKRLQSELTESHSLSVSFTNRRQANMTIAECDAKLEILLYKKQKTVSIWAHR